MGLHVLDIERNAEGSKLAYMSPKGEGGGYRIAGPKAWGGSSKIASIEISDRDLFEYIKCYAPDVRNMILQLPPAEPEVDETNL